MTYDVYIHPRFHTQLVGFAPDNSRDVIRLVSRYRGSDVSGGSLAGMGWKVAYRIRVKQTRVSRGDL